MFWMSACSSATSSSVRAPMDPSGLILRLHSPSTISEAPAQGGRRGSIIIRSFIIRRGGCEKEARRYPAAHPSSARARSCRRP
eukprot:7493200-Pyramimonas_sp.AAC.1